MNVHARRRKIEPGIAFIEDGIADVLTEAREKGPYWSSPDTITRGVARRGSESSSDKLYSRGKGDMGMPEATNLFLGFDPGGKRRFGWSIVSEVGGNLQPCPRTGLADDAWDAIIQVKAAITSLGHSGDFCIRGAGIDAPLLWTKRGERRVEGVLREALRNTGFPPEKLGGTVQAVNSLRGACVVQGSLLVRHLIETWDLAITESHPAVFRHLLSNVGPPGMETTANRLTAGMDSHERDATLCAVAAFAAQQQPSLPKWRNLYAEEPCLIRQFDRPVSYWMPIP